MGIQLNTPENQSKKLDPDLLDTYVNFRNMIYKPSAEETHLRHILRFYIARGLKNVGAKQIYILPMVTVDGKTVQVDVAAEGGARSTLAICEPESITEETLQKLEVLKNAPEWEVIVVHSQFGSANGVDQKFKPQIETRQFRIMAVVPPPFDDVYEYDIWMFETTFRELFAGE